jgi:hypothetical protein
MAQLTEKQRKFIAKGNSPRRPPDGHQISVKITPEKVDSDGLDD